LASTSLGLSGSSTVRLAAGCSFRVLRGETVACESLPVQMISGPDKKVAYRAEYFRRALNSCGPSATIQVGNPAKATLFEAEDYWHILMPREGFPCPRILGAILVTNWLAPSSTS